jgi:predicted O-methyltransferase YrrM
LKKSKELKGTETPEELIAIAMGCSAIRPQQSTSEFLELAKLIKDHNCSYILEIGTYRGGTLFVSSQLAAANATIVSIDFSTTLFGHLYRAAQAPLLHSFIRKGQSLSLLRKDSHQDSTLETILQCLKGHKLDYLFIDGDHRYMGVKKDFEMYSPLVREGGMIAFHDIAPKDDMESVPKFWQEIKKSFKHREIIHQNKAEAMGIGVLWM